MLRIFGKQFLDLKLLSRTLLVRQLVDVHVKLIYVCNRFGDRCESYRHNCECGIERKFREREGGKRENASVSQLPYTARKGFVGNRAEKNNLSVSDQLHAEGNGTADQRTEQKRQLGKKTFAVRGYQHRRKKRYESHHPRDLITVGGGRNIGKGISRKGQTYYYRDRAGNGRRKYAVDDLYSEYLDEYARKNRDKTRHNDSELRDAYRLGRQNAVNCLKALCRNKTDYRGHIGEARTAEKRYLLFCDQEEAYRRKTAGEDGR